MGGHWQPYEGLRMGGKVVEAKSEMEFYAALDFHAIRPRDREMGFLQSKFGK